MSIQKADFVYQNLSEMAIPHLYSFSLSISEVLALSTNLALIKLIVKGLIPVEI